MKVSKKCTAFFVAAVLLISTLFTAVPKTFAADGETHGNFVISGGTYGVDYEYVTGTSPIQIQGYGTNESYNTTYRTPKSGGVINVAMDVLKIYTSTPLTISTNGTSSAGIQIEKGVQADLTFDGVTINSVLPVNIVPNTVEKNTWGRPLVENAADANNNGVPDYVESGDLYTTVRAAEDVDTNGDGVIDYLENPTSLHLTLADGSVNTLTASLNSYTYQFPGLRCGEGAKLTIDDGRRNVDTDGNFVAPEQGRISRDATLQDGTEVKKGDRLTLLDSENPGTLNVNGGFRASAIGGAALESSGDMTFNGGNIVTRAYGVSEALSDYGPGAGIGGGHAGCGTTMTFNGGNIDSIGSYHGAGIGGGCTYGGGMSNGRVTYALTDGYLSQFPLNTVAGDININGGFLKSVGCTHSNAFGQACGGTNNGRTITITGGTLLPSSVSGWYDIGGAGGDVIVTGGSVRLTGGSADKFQSNGGVAWGDLDKTIKVFMTTINMSAYDKPNMLVDGMKITVNGIPSVYGMPSYTDESGNLYFWLPNTEDGTAPEVRVDLNLKDQDGEEVVTEPFFITNATQGAVLKQYVVFSIDESLITDENRLKKRYDGLAFTDAQQTAFLTSVVKDGIAVTAPAGQLLTNVDQMTIQSQRLNADLEVDDTEAIISGTNANVGKYQLTITSNQYANTAGFNNAFWGHRCYYKYAEITPADSKTIVSVAPVSDDIAAADTYDADTALELKAFVSPADAEALTCAAPTGKVQFYINGKAYGDPVSIEACEDTEESNASGHKQSVAKITWTPTQNGGKYAVEGEQEVYAKYIVQDKDNYNESKADTAKFNLKTVNQGNEDIGGNPIQVTDKTDGTVISPENSTISKIYGDNFTLELDGGDTDEAPIFVSSNPDIAIVDEDGNVTIVGVGEVVITVTRPGNGAYKSESQEITVKAGKKEISITDVDILDKYYDGNTDAEIDPDSVVINGIVKGDEDKFKDYLTSSASFPDSKAGTYTDASATFKLVGELAEKYCFKQPDSSQKDSITLIDDAIIISKPINTPAEGDEDNYTISVAPIKDYSWTGNEITPPLVVKDGDKVLVEGVDYTVEYKNNIDVGTADVIINGLGNYQGTLNTEFKIVPVNIDTDGDGVPDINVDTDGDGEPDINIDTDGDLEPDINIDTDGDGEPDVNIDTDGDGKPDINIDTDGDGKPDINIDTDGDGDPDINIDIDGDGDPDIDIDTDGDGIPDENIDEDDDLRVDTYVVVNFVSTNGDVLAEQIVKRGNMGDAYSTDELSRDDFYGYKLVAVPENANGEMNKVKTEVNYVYELKKTSVIINYVDENGNSIADTITINGNVFDEFSSSRKTVYGYRLIDITENRTSAFARFMRSVARVFKSSDDLVDVSGVMEEDVIIINYIYEIKESEVKVHYIDENGNEIDDSVTIEGKVFDEYSTSSKDIYGYKLIDSTPNSAGDMAEETTDVFYVYKQVLNIDTDGDGEPDINIDTDKDGEPDINIDTDDDGKPDVNIDTDKDGEPDVNIDTDKDGEPDVNIDTDKDGEPDVNIDTDKDGEPDVNIDTDKDGEPDVNIDTDKDGKPDVNIDTDKDGKPDVNIDTDKDGKPDINIDTDGDGKPDINIDTDGDGKPDINIDTDDDGKPDINIDTTGNGKADINIDTDGDGKADLNIDADGDGIADYNIDTDGDGIADKNIIGAETPVDTGSNDMFRIAIFSMFTLVAAFALVLIMRKNKKESEAEAE